MRLAVKMFRLRENCVNFFRSNAWTLCGYTMFQCCTFCVSGQYQFTIVVWQCNQLTSDKFQVSRGELCWAAKFKKNSYVDMPFFCPFGKNVSSSCGGAAPLVSWSSKQVKINIIVTLRTIYSRYANKWRNWKYSQWPLLALISCFASSNINFNLLSEIEEMWTSNNLHRIRAMNCSI